jgi:hypothetical protein
VIRFSKMHAGIFRSGKSFLLNFFLKFLGCEVDVFCVSRWCMVVSPTGIGGGKLASGHEWRGLRIQVEAWERSRDHRWV